MVDPGDCCHKKDGRRRFMGCKCPGAHSVYGRPAWRSALATRRRTTAEKVKENMGAAAIIHHCINLHKFVWKTVT